MIPVLSNVACASGNTTQNYLRSDLPQKKLSNSHLKLDIFALVTHQEQNPRPGQT